MRCKEASTFKPYSSVYRVSSLLYSAAVLAVDPRIVKTDQQLERDVIDAYLVRRAPSTTFSLYADDKDGGGDRSLRRGGLARVCGEPGKHMHWSLELLASPVGFPSQVSFKLSSNSCEISYVNVGVFVHQGLER